MKGVEPASFKIHSYELTEDKNDFIIMVRL